jgi:hypothetical protein
MYAHLVTLWPGDSGTVDVTWWAADGANDSNGVDISQRAPVVEVATVRDGALVLAEHGDDSGERRESHLVPTRDGGYVGDVTWTLFTVAGDTTWHVDIAP